MRLRRNQNQCCDDRNTGSFISKFNRSGMIIAWMLVVVMATIMAAVVMWLAHIGLFRQQPVIQLSFDSHSCYLKRTQFDLKWLHSVEKQWWIESYEIEEGHLLLTDTYLQTFGAGTPSTEALSQDAKPKYAGYVHYQIDTTLPYLDWMISSNIQATIINQGRELPIYRWVSDYTNIHIAPKVIPAWKLWFKEPCHEYYSRTVAAERS